MQFRGPGISIITRVLVIIILIVRIIILNKHIGILRIVKSVWHIMVLKATSTGTYRSRGPCRFSLANNDSYLLNASHYRIARFSMHGIRMYYYIYAVRSLERVSREPIFNDTWCIIFGMLLTVCINVINLYFTAVDSMRRKAYFSFTLLCRNSITFNQNIRSQNALQYTEFILL